MNVLILYFSGTGNTQFIAEEIKRGLTSNSINTSIASIEEFKPEDTKDFDIVLFGFPVYAFDIPLFLESYISKLSVPKLKGVYLFSTLGFYGGNALRKAAKRFTSKGFTVLGGQEVKMPGSDGLAFSKKDSKFASRALSKNFSKISEVENTVSDIVNINIKKATNISAFRKHNNGIKVKIISKLIDPLLIMIFRPIEKLLKRKLWADDNCIRCRLCEKICPAENISITYDKVKFSDKCYLCFRCLHQCPKEAIQIGKITVGKFRWKGPKGDFTPKNH